MIRATIAVLATVACAACAAPAVRAPASRMTADELHRYCLGQMYAERVSRGRSAVNWHVYDYCLRRHA